jgi:hypothetical protein
MNGRTLSRWFPERNKKSIRQLRVCSAGVTGLRDAEFTRPSETNGKHVVTTRGRNPGCLEQLGSTVSEVFEFIFLSSMKLTFQLGSAQVRLPLTGRSNWT